MTLLLNFVSTIAMVVVMVAAAMHLNIAADRHSDSIERYGFALTGAGALGQALANWWFPPHLIEVLLHVGLALVGAAMVSGQVGQLVHTVFTAPSWNGRDRRSRGNNSERNTT